jgi:chorismate mutase
MVEVDAAVVDRAHFADSHDRGVGFARSTDNGWDIMDAVRHNDAIVVGVLIATLLSALMVGAPTSRADDDDPLYDLVDAAAARLASADPVAAFKWVKGGSIEDSKRVGEVLDSVGAQASAKGIDPQDVRAVFTDQIHATESVEYARFAQWKLDPSGAPTSAPDLSASRAAIDGFNRTMVTQIAQHWDTLRSPDCDQDVVHAVGAVTMDRRLDPMYQQALTFATRSYCTPT